jgi:hypothetical protein
MAGTPGVTVKEFAMVTISDAVVTVMLQNPRGAPGEIDTGTVMLVAVTDVGDPAIPQAKVTEDALLK